MIREENQRGNNDFANQLYFEIGDVRTILLIEDTPRNYSNLLPVLYKEIIFHTKELMNKSLNTEQRLLHMRARPKILLAKTYEEAEDIYKKYNKNSSNLC